MDYLHISNLGVILIGYEEADIIKFHKFIRTCKLDAKSVTWLSYICKEISDNIDNIFNFIEIDYRATESGNFRLVTIPTRVGRRYGIKIFLTSYTSLSNFYLDILPTSRKNVLLIKEFLKSYVTFLYNLSNEHDLKFKLISFPAVFPDSDL